MTDIQQEVNFSDLIFSVSPALFARKAGVSTVSVYNWRKGTHEPKRLVKDRIKKVYAAVGIKVIF